jgi:hypothetical protein
VQLCCVVLRNTVKLQQTSWHVPQQANTKTSKQNFCLLLCSFGVRFQERDCNRCNCAAWRCATLSSCSRQVGTSLNRPTPKRPNKIFVFSCVVLVCGSKSATAIGATVLHGAAQRCQVAADKLARPSTGQHQNVQTKFLSSLV